MHSYALHQYFQPNERKLVKVVLNPYLSSRPLGAGLKAAAMLRIYWVQSFVTKDSEPFLIHNILFDGTSTTVQATGQPLDYPLKATMFNIQTIDDYLYVPNRVRQQIEVDIENTTPELVLFSGGFIGND